MRNLWDVVRCGLACTLVVAGLNFAGCAKPSGEGEPAAGEAAGEAAGHDHGEEGHDHAAEGGEEAGSGSSDGSAAPEGGSSASGDAGADL